MQIETGSVQEDEILTNSIKDKLGDIIETHTKTTESKTENNKYFRGNLHRQHRGNHNGTEPRNRQRKRGNYS